MDSSKIRLRSLRGSMKQSDLADKLGISQNMISNYENGREPPIDVLEKYAKYFNVTTDYIIGLSSERQPDSTDISKHIAELSEKVHNSALPIVKSDITAFFDAFIAYYNADAPAGNAPLDASRQFIQVVPQLLNAIVSNDAASVLANVNDAAAAALAINQILVQYLSDKKDKA